MDQSKNTSRADNQQGSPLLQLQLQYDPSETTRQIPHSQEIKAYVLGALHDGTFSQNKRFRIAQKGTGWLVIIKYLLSTAGYRSWIYKEGKERNVYVLETCANFLNIHFNPLLLTTKKERIAYIRGFFDAEGGMPHNGQARFYIQLVQKNKPKLEKLKQMLAILNINTGRIHNPSYRVDPDYWRMYVLSKSQQTFITVIGSWHPRKIHILEKRNMI